MPIVTALYAGLLGLISMGVAFPAGSLRGKLKSLGRFIGAAATAAVTVISSVWLIVLFAHRLA
jgi:hypothetical protein